MRNRINSVQRAALVAGCLLLAATTRGFAGEALDGHSAEAPAAARRVTTSTFQYPVPNVRLVRDDDRVVALPQEMNDGRPVLLNFIFTTCSSICPLMTEIFSQFEHKLGPDSERVHLMSISVDPEEDTPARLKEYAHKFQAGPEWQHYTGTIEASLAVQRAFNVWRGDKMSHSPVTFVRAAPDHQWVRIEGFVTPDELLRIYRESVAQSKQTLATR
jgi:protein SCO1